MYLPSDPGPDLIPAKVSVCAHPCGGDALTFSPGFRILDSGCDVIVVWPGHDL